MKQLQNLCTAIGLPALAHLIQAVGPQGLRPALTGVQTDFVLFVRAGISLHGTTIRITKHASLPRGGTAPLASRKWTQSGVTAHPPRVLQEAQMPRVAAGTNFYDENGCLLFGAVCCQNAYYMVVTGL